VHPGRFAPLRTAERTEYAEEALARSAFAWDAWRAVFRWRQAYGEPKAVVSGVCRGIVETPAEPPWAYVQYTYFTHLPCFALPAEDEFGVFRMLQAQPWWEYTGRLASTQRIYDACNAIALARAGRGDQVRRHRSTVSERPFHWQWFDETPVLEVAALAWLSTAGVVR
jgi:hypothetical protein